MQFDRIRDAFINDALTLVRIPSVGHPEPGYVNGKNAADCLAAALAIFARFGFRTFTDPEGYYGYAEIGAGPLFGILGHLDVVPARREDGWNTDPFVPAVIDGRIYGRGIQDDKGPLLTAAYALKSLLDEGAVLKYRVRFILGIAEETSWACINHYVAKEEIPVMSFTPDSGFPFVYAEKGLLQVEYSTKAPAKTAFSGGDSMNAVAAFAHTGRHAGIEAALRAHGYAFKEQGEQIEVVGRGAHAKNPWRGENAIFHLAQAIRESGGGDCAVDFLCDCLVGKERFEGFSDENFEDFSGPLSVNCGVVTAGPEGTRIGLDLRLPVTTTTREQVLELLRARGAEYGLEMKQVDWLRSIYLPLDSELALALTHAYQSVTGDTQSKPKVSGGATYARALDNCVAFGPNFPGEETTEHMPNEYAKIDNLMKAMEIYAVALDQLVVAH